MTRQILVKEKLIDTIGLLCKRIRDRFPDSSLLQVCRRLHGIARESQRDIERIQKDIERGVYSEEN